MSTRTATWLAWTVCALSLALTALCFLLIALTLRLNTPIYVPWLELTVLAIGYSVIGAVIASRVPNHPIGWICCAIGFIAAVDHFGGEYAVYALLAHPDALPGGRAMLWLQGRSASSSTARSFTRCPFDLEKFCESLPDKVIAP